MSLGAEMALFCVWLVGSNYAAILLMNLSDGVPLEPIISIPRALIISLTPLGWIIAPGLWLFPFVWLLSQIMGDD